MPTSTRVRITRFHVKVDILWAFFSTTNVTQPHVVRQRSTRHMVSRCTKHNSRHDVRRACTMTVTKNPSNKGMLSTTTPRLERARAALKAHVFDNPYTPLSPAVLTAELVNFNGGRVQPQSVNPKHTLIFRVELGGHMVSRRVVTESRGNGALRSKMSTKVHFYSMSSTSHRWTMAGICSQQNCIDPARQRRVALFCGAIYCEVAILLH